MRRRRSFICLLLALIMSVQMLLPAFAESGFSDVPAGVWYSEPVGWAVQEGITLGVSTTEFAPARSCTRAQIVTFIWRAAGCPDPEPAKDDCRGEHESEPEPQIEECRGDPRSPAGEQCSPLRSNGEAALFTDVPESAYYYKAVLWAVGKGITNGTSETAFSPNASCTRAQAVTFLWRAEGCPDPEPAKDDCRGEQCSPQRSNGEAAPFTDVPESAYYYKAVLWAVENGVTSGTGKTTFSPNAPCTRAQIVTFLYRAAHSTAPEEPTDEPETEGSEQTLLVPQIRIVTDDGVGLSLQKADGYVDASVTITDVDGSVLEDTIQLKVRGNSTALAGIKKKAFTFKLSKKRDVLGLGKGKKWALLANCFDPTLLRNALANHIAKTLELEYTSNRCYAELWLDDSFRGCYELYVPIQANKERIDLDLESNDGMQDFLLEYERSREEEGETYFKVSGLRFCLKEPEEPNEQQLQYVTDTMQAVVDTLKTGDRTQISQIIDTQSFAKFYLLNEFLKTLDFDMSSVYFYYRGGRLYAGPIWDFDLSSGNVNRELGSRPNSAGDPEGLYAAGKNLYRYLTDQAWFLEEVRAAYHAHADYFASLYADGGLLDTMLHSYQPVFARNFGEAGWSVTKWWINYQKKPLPSYRENYEFLKDWLRQRDAYLKEYFTNPAE